MHGNLKRRPYAGHESCYRLVSASGNLTNDLANAQETKPPTVPSNIPALPHTNWTHRYKESGQPADYQLYDQIWVSNALAGRVTGA